MSSADRTAVDVFSFYSGQFGVFCALLDPPAMYTIRRTMKYVRCVVITMQ